MYRDILSSRNVTITPISTMDKRYILETMAAKLVAAKKELDIRLSLINELGDRLRLANTEIDDLNKHIKGIYKLCNMHSKHIKSWEGYYNGK